MKTQPRPHAASEIPTSPTADIAFLLLVFFVLTATFSVHRGLDFGLPREPGPTPVETVESVLVEVLPAGLRVDRQSMELTQLLPYLRSRLDRNPDKPVILKTSADAPYGSMVEVYDELRRAIERQELPPQMTIAIPTQREIRHFWM